MNGLTWRNILRRGRKSTQRYSLQLGYCAVLLTAVWLFSFVVVSRDFAQTIRDIEQNNDQLVRAYEEHVRRSLHGVEEQMLLIKSEYERAGITPAVATMLERARRNPLLLQIVLVDEAGKLTATVHQGAPGLNYADRDFFQAHTGADYDQTFISRPEYGRITKKRSTYLSRRINKPDGSFGGVVAMAVDSAYFTSFYQALDFKPGQLVRVIGLDGVIRASWRGDALEIGQNMQGSQLFEELLPRVPQGRFYGRGKLSGIPRYFSYRLMPDYPLVVQVGIDADAALAEYRVRRDLYSAAAAVGSLLIFIFTGYAIISARRQRQQNERWQLVVEGANDGIWDYDLKVGRRYFSDRCKAILGYLPTEFDENRQDWTEHIHPEDAAAVKKARADHIQGQSATYQQTFRLRSKNGDYRWVCSKATAMRDDSGAIYRLIGTLTDVHVEKEASEALRISQQETIDSREKYKAVIEQSFEAVALLDPDSWQFLEVNCRFSEWFGYRLPEDAPLYRDALRIDDTTDLSQYDDALFRQGYLPVQRRNFRHKNGSTVNMERSAKIIQYQSKRLVMITFRNIADQLQQEQARRQDAVIARRIQQAQLSCPPDNEYVSVETLYHASGEISGDLYHLEWRNDGQLLRGYLIDVSGHALTTALYTSTLNVLLHEAAELDASLSEQVGWLNRQVARHFEANAFAAAIAFELDLPARELRYVGAGMNRFWANMAAVEGTVTVAGHYLGISRQDEYLQQSLPLAAGDRLCFISDGMERLLEADPRGAKGLLGDCRKLRAALSEVAKSEELADDATAVCIRVKALPHSLLSERWPKQLTLNGLNDYRRLKGEVAKLLAEATGLVHSMQEVAVNEAIANALECRDGQARSQKARLKFSRAGKWLIVRVKTSRIGFAGNAMLRRLRANPDSLFSFGEDAGMGRGIPIMLSTTGRMTYNSEGTEVLLAWKLG